MGFVPDMMSHSHGSTAICGIAYYADEKFPEPFRGRIYSGNVMTSRINCNRLERDGATVRAIEMPDFLTSDDPWFRPVDLQLGPDGALYVADFYNKIIGHYEVPLTHPERDRDSGRIWRIVWRGDVTDQKSVKNTSIEKRDPSTVDRSIPELLSVEYFKQLASSYSVMRDHTLDRLMENKLSDSDIAVLQAKIANTEAVVHQRTGALWALHRADRLDESTLISEIPKALADKFMAFAEGRMKKKVLGAVEAIREGVGKVIFADGRVDEPISRALAGAGTHIH
jgi:hypothetical protein